MQTFAPALLSLTALAAPLAAQSSTIVLRDGDVLPGIGTVQAAASLNVSIADDGTWLAVAQLTGSSQYVALRGKTKLYRTGEPLSEPAGATVFGTGFSDLDARGESVVQMAYSVPGSGNEGVYRDQRQIVRRGIAPLASGWAPGTTYADLNTVQLTRTNRVLLQGLCSEPGVGGALAFLSVLQLDAQNNLIGEALVARSGAQLPGQPWPVTDVTLYTDHHSINSAGQVIYAVRTPSVGPSARGAVLLWNGTTSSVLAETATPAPIPGASWIACENASVALNDSGDWAIRCELVPPASQTGIQNALFKNGVKVAASGDPFSLSGTAGEILATVTMGVDALANNGDLVWIARTNGIGGTNAALMVNGTVLVQQQVTPIDGQTIYSIDPTYQCSISPNGRFVILRARVQPSTACIVVIDRQGGGTSFCAGDGSGTACPCGNAGAAGRGCANSVEASGGRLVASGNASLLGPGPVLQGSGMPNGSALYFQGTNKTSAGAGAVFGDGLRCASGTVIRIGTKANVAGTSQYPQVGDPSIASVGLVPSSGHVRHYQVWYRNAASFCTASTFNTTNGVTLFWTP